MPSQTTTTTEDGAPQLAEIELRYEQAKARIAGVAVPAGSDGPVHDTVAVDVRITTALIPAHRQADDDPGPGRHRPRRGRRFWRSLRLPRSVGRSLPAA